MTSLWDVGQVQANSEKYSQRINSVESYSRNVKMAVDEFQPIVKDSHATQLQFQL